MFGEHPELDGEVRYDFGCAWYADHGPYFSNLQAAWFIIGLPCIVVTILALLSTCGHTGMMILGLCCPGARTTRQGTAPAASLPTSVHYDNVYGPLIDVTDVNINVERDVNHWVIRGSCGAISYGVLLLALAVFIALHANNEAKFSFWFDAVVALLMFASKVVVTLCARIVHRHLSPLSRQVAKQWVSVLAFSKGLTALSAMLLMCIYLVLAILGVDANRGDGSRRRLSLRSLSTNSTCDCEHGPWDNCGDECTHGPTPDEQAQLCAAGFFMVWSFLITLVSQSIAGFAFFQIYLNAVRFFGDTRVFFTVVSIWWTVLVASTCSVGIALWLGVALCVFPSLDISPLRMMGFFYSGSGVAQILAGSAMLLSNCSMRRYWAKQIVTISSTGSPTMLGAPVHVSQPAVQAPITAMGAPVFASDQQLAHNELK